jgi:catechol 2,3-dioxygenase-like lactoylglutathione lyase family enzyme
MGTTAVRPQDATAGTRIGQVDMKLEVVTIPVSDMDLAKEFYGSLGWRLDADFRDGDERAIQFTPPGSQCSIHFTTKGKPGSAQGLFLVVSDIQAARNELVQRRVEVGEVFHFAKPPFGEPVSGIAPNRQSYGSWAKFTDPDGNGWVLQEVTTRFPGRIDSHATTFASAADLASAFRRAEAAHGEHEKRTGERDAEWPTWYAAYMVAEQAGTELPT